MLRTMLTYRNISKFVKPLLATKYFRPHPIVTRLASRVVQSEHFDHVDFQNETPLDYHLGSEEMMELEATLDRFGMNCQEIPIVINGKEIKTGNVRHQVMPHRHKIKIARFYHADEKIIKQAINAAIEAQVEWDRTPISYRANIWNDAADLMAKTYRAQLVAATMLGQSKNIIQAEMDAAVELIDLMRMNAAFLKQATNYEPINMNEQVGKNYMRFRGIDGFVAAISPFNFTSIAGNLACTPALMGNSVLWKPSDTAMLSNWYIFNIMREAGLPDGVINFVPADGPTFGRAIANSEHLAGINFTGKADNFRKLWKLVVNNIENYRNFPRLVGDCGGKNFHFVHQSADVDTVVAATIRSAFEYSGQKCSSCSRLYVPEDLWEESVKEELVTRTKELYVGDVREIENFLSAVIDKEAFHRAAKYIAYARMNADCEILAGGTYRNLSGYFVDPTIILVKDPDDRLFQDEIFAPILAVYVYNNSDLEEMMDLVANSTKYALTGSVFGEDEHFIQLALEKFKMAAGNFYINDKSTGSVVGQQPFGGGRMSGTNDKAGGPHYILRWTSPQSIKETYKPTKDIYYPYMYENSD